jgi:hypothetical protein
VVDHTIEAHFEVHAGVTVEKKPDLRAMCIERMAHAARVANPGIDEQFAKDMAASVYAMLMAFSEFHQELKRDGI